jgi:capsule biosynthesis phosphatase
MIYCFDLDNTICSTDSNNYSSSYPNDEMILKVNNLFDVGHYIKIFTARGMTTYKGNVSLVYNNLFDLTTTQLKSWGVKYNELILGKPSFDFFIDDKNLSIEDFKKNTNPKIGFIAGAFDVIHPGYIHMFELAKKNCEYLVVGLHNNPSIERGKPKPILSKEERKKILTSLKYVDEVFFYNTESELISLTENVKPDILFLGDDYIGKDHNGLKLNINTFFIPRKHGWSATKFKKMIKEQ